MNPNTMVTALLVLAAMLAIALPVVLAVASRRAPLGVRLYLLAIPVSVGLLWFTMHLLEVAGPPAGSHSGVSPEVMAVVFSPTILLALGGLVVAGYGVHRHAWGTVGVGALGMVAAGVEYVVVMFAVVLWQFL